MRNYEVMFVVKPTVEDEATKAIVELLRDEEEDVDDWQIAAIEAALDKTNESKYVSFDLPYCILGMLGAQYRGDKYKKYM